MRKTALVLATAATLGLSSVTAPSPAEARGGWGWGGALAGGLLAGALIGGLASSAYGYGPGYGYYRPGYGYYGGYAPAYYGYGMADHTTGIGGLIIVDIVRLTIVRTTVRVSTGDGAAGRN